MNIFVEKNFFSNELRLFQGIFEKKNIMDILQNIKISASANGVIELVATDLEIGLSSSLQAKVVDAGTFTINGKDLYELISKMPDGNVEIFEDNDLQVSITNEKKTSKYKLLALQSSDYPKLPTNDFSTSFKIPISVLYSLIYKVYYVVTPEMKFNLGGALFKVSENKIEMAATDGHRLAYAFSILNLDCQESIEFIISRKTLQELIKIGESGAGDIEFSYDKNNIFFKYKNLILSSRIIDQKFPNYKAVIPEKLDSFLVIGKDELVQILRRVMVFKTRNNGVYFKFNQNKLSLERSTPDKGEAYDEIDIQYDANPIAVAFNGNFILDFLTHVNSEKIQIHLKDNESSFLFQEYKEDKVSEDKFFYVLMPLNI